MKNKYFEEEEITENDLYFICYMIERVARHLQSRKTNSGQCDRKRGVVPSVKLRECFAL